MQELWKELDSSMEGLDVVGFGRFLHNLQVVGDETVWGAVRSLCFDAEFS